MKKKGKLTTPEIEEYLEVTRSTALRTMTELMVLGLVDKKVEIEDAYNSIQSIQLKKEFNWFLSEEFKKLRDSFIPEKFEEKGCKEKSPPPTLKKYDDGEDFDYEYLKQIAWKEFKQIEANEITYVKEHLVVEHKNLRNAILTNPDAIKMKITKEAADISIDILLKQGMLSKVMDVWYYRTTKNDNPAAATAAA
ncbi:MAG TPA: hypothetical protein VFT71_03000 [Candidatus Nitrosocosmicus sp.]|nr:hypothetical protein [Candidatus Nitrosocosmicus sp.]